MNSEDTNDPNESDRNREIKHRELLKPICPDGNHDVANLFAEFSMKQYPKLVTQVPTKNK